MTKPCSQFVAQIVPAQVFSQEHTKGTKFGEAIFRNLRDLRGGISFLSGCVAILSALLVPAFGNTQSLCVRLTHDGGAERSVPIQFGNTLRLSFRHSMYGSQVEEIFTLRRQGFELTQLRYGEARLVDFYGHEHAQAENGMWVVTPTPTLFPTLNLHLSADAAMSIKFDADHSTFKPIAIQPNSALRLTIVSCKSSAHG